MVWISVAMPQGEQVGVDQQGELVLRQMQGAAENQWNGDGVGIHDQDVLQAERGHAWYWQHLIDGVDGGGGGHLRSLAG